MTTIGRYRGDTNLAIRSFNVARLARDYEVDAICAMVESCLTPALHRVYPSFSSSPAATTAYLDSDMRSVRPTATANTTANSMEAGEATSTSRFSDAIAAGQPSGDMDAEDVESTGYETAAFLLVRLRSCQMHYPRIHRFLYNLHMAMSRDKVKVEKALQSFAEMNEECESVPAIYGASVCYLLLGQDQKAKNQLKRLAKYAWTPEVGDLFPN
ncbi:Tetratricopeptide repeat protein 21B [Taenia solium]|eukprot:TsM_000253400 transcript=TsM_000253400 gene=TsM_000253400